MNEPKEETGQMRNHTIREAEIKDIPDLCKLTYQQWTRENLGAIGHTFSMANSFKNYEMCIKGNLWEVMLADIFGTIVGYIVTQYHPMPYDFDSILCQEVGWFVGDGYEKRGIGWGLVDAVERRAYAKGCKHFSLGSPSMEWTQERATSYLKRGYMPAEVICFKHMVQPPAAPTKEEEGVPEVVKEDVK